MQSDGKSMFSAESARPIVIQAAQRKVPERKAARNYSSDIYIYDSSIEIQLAWVALAACG
jgi:hypothetical protein